MPSIGLDEKFAKLEMFVKTTVTGFDKKLANRERANTNIPCSGADVSDIRGEFDQFKAYVATYLSELKELISDTVDRLEDMECYSRKNCLLIHGVEERQEECVQKIVLDFIKQNLNIGDIRIDHIDNCHRLGPRKQSARNPRAIIVKLCSYLFRRRMWLAKKYLKGTKFFISESLTRRRSEIYKRCRETFGQKQSYTSDGRVIIVTPSGSRVAINNFKDLEKAASSQDFSEYARKKPFTRSAAKGSTTEEAA